MQRAAIVFHSSPLPCPHIVNKSIACLSATTVPIGGICEIGRRDFTRRMIALDSGCSGLMIRDSSCASGTSQWPRLFTLVASADAHVNESGSSRTVYFKFNPSDAIEPSLLWQLPQFVDR